MEYNCPDCLQLDRECYNCRRAMSATGAPCDLNSEVQGEDKVFRIMLPLESLLEEEDNPKPKKKKKTKNPLAELDMGKVMEEVDAERQKELPLDFAKFKVEPKLEPKEEAPEEDPESKKE